ncbi:MAG: calcium-binding protein, partial [Planctomycetales bacterium]|nr:calcium-binding protein [Planctomycetales bacterium]
DQIDSGSGSFADLVLGDNGTVVFYATGVLGEVTTTDADTGAGDTIVLGDGQNLALGGDGNDHITAGMENDVVLGDHGNVHYDEQLRLQSIATLVQGTGGDDDLLLGDGDDIALGGAGDDFVNVDRDSGQQLGSDTGVDLVIGDHGSVTLDPADSASIVRNLTTSTPLDAGNDTIFTDGGEDVVFGGSGDDNIDTGSAAERDWVVGDNGSASYDSTGVLSQLETIDPAEGGADQINAGDGSDVVFGGAGVDYVHVLRGTTTTISTDGGRDVIVGDNAVAHFDNVDGAAVLRFVDTTSVDIGAGDFLFGDAGNDIILGGAGGDWISGGVGGDLLFGDAAEVNLNTSEQLLDATTTDPTIGGADSLQGGAGDDTAVGGTGNDTLTGGTGHDILLGDHALIDRDLPANQQFTSIFTATADAGGADTMHGDDGDDFLLGQQAGDSLYGGAGDDDITGGHNVLHGDDSGDLIDGGSEADVVLGDNGLITRQLINGQTNQWQRHPAPFADVIREVQRYDDIDFIQGNDTIVGQAGDDILHGQRGNDTIDGGEGDDEILGELGDDSLSGGSGHDVLLADVGRIVRDYNDNGSARRNENGWWHRDVFLEDVGTIIGKIDLDTTPLRTLDPQLAQKLLSADLAIAAGAFQQNSQKVMNTDTNTWDTDLLLIDVTPANHDQLDGG